MDCDYRGVTEVTGDNDYRGVTEVTWIVNIKV